jgi:Xaa-Pro aminopeptidase
MDKLRDGMEKIGTDAVLVIQKMDYYYLSGTTQDGLLFMPVEGKPLLMVRRELERAGLESPLQDVVSIKSLRDLPSIINNHWGKLPKVNSPRLWDLNWICSRLMTISDIRIFFQI